MTHPQHVINNHVHASSASPIGSNGTLETYIKKIRMMTKKMMMMSILSITSSHHDNHVRASSASRIGSNGTLETYIKKDKDDDEEADDDEHRDDDDDDDDELT